jgi:hypothetical protein
VIVCLYHRDIQEAIGEKHPQIGSHSSTKRSKTNAWKRARRGLSARQVPPEFHPGARADSALFQEAKELFAEKSQRR